MKKGKNFWEISWSGLWRILIFVFLGTIIYLSREILLALFLAIIISAGLDFFVDFLEKRGLPRILGTLLIFISIGALIIIILYTIIPLIIIDLNTILNNLNKYGLNKFFPLIDLKLKGSLSEIINKISTQFLETNAPPLELLFGILSNTVLLVSVIISSFYLCLTKNGIERFIRAVFPQNYEAQALLIYEKSRQKISRWFRAQIFLSFTIFILVFIALSILGVKNSLFIAILAGIFEIVPYVGPIISGGVAVLSALTSSIPLAIYTLIVFILIQQTENHILVPLFMKKSVDLHPVIVIGALMIGGKIAGILGIIISVPTAVIIQEIIEAWNVKSKNL